jgi:hypothetical protein
MIMGLFSDVSLAFPDWDDSVSVCYDEEDSYKVIHPNLRDKYCIQEIAEPFEYSEEVYAKFMRKMAWLDNAHGTSLQEHNPDFFDIDVYPEYAIIEYNKVKR